MAASGGARPAEPAFIPGRLFAPWAGNSRIFCDFESCATAGRLFTKYWMAWNSFFNSF